MFICDDKDTNRQTSIQTNRHKRRKPIPQGKKNNEINPRIIIEHKEPEEKETLREDGDREEHKLDSDSEEVDVDVKIVESNKQQDV